MPVYLKKNTFDPIRRVFFYMDNNEMDLKNTFGAALVFNSYLVFKKGSILSIDDFAI